ncbi:cytochrome aa3 quinol oxidase subunit IV [Sesbania bispinosa]|nr:cytochrome aa3 quinol oxidase subunit IV [Sesbania bispinosa]
MPKCKRRYGNFRREQEHVPGAVRNAAKAEGFHEGKGSQRRCTAILEVFHVTFGTLFIFRGNMQTKLFDSSGRELAHHRFLQSPACRQRSFTLGSIPVYGPNPPMFGPLFYSASISFGVVDDDESVASHRIGSFTGVKIKASLSWIGLDEELQLQAKEADIIMLPRNQSGLQFDKFVEIDQERGGQSSPVHTDVTTVFPFFASDPSVGTRQCVSAEFNNTGLARPRSATSGSPTSRNN